MHDCGSKHILALRSFLLVALSGLPEPWNDINIFLAELRNNVPPSPLLHDGFRNVPDGQ